MSSLPLIASLSADGRYGFWENAVYLTTGFIIVIGALTVLWAMCFLVGRFFRAQEAAAQPAPADAPKAEAAAVPVEEDGIDPAIIAVITAAIQVAVHQPMRIRSVRTTSTPGSNQARHNAWALEGRSSQFQSHKVR
ncbi:MAG: OadG family transporter subunit [Verrucomicrobiota bacterium]